MIKTKHIASYDGTLDEAIHEFISAADITRENLVSVEYSTRVMHVQIPDGDGVNPQFAETWFASALIVYDEAEE